MVPRHGDVQSTESNLKTPLTGIVFGRRRDALHFASVWRFNSARNPADTC
jgi:hypothetical protein